MSEGSGRESGNASPVHGRSGRKNDSAKTAGSLKSSKPTAGRSDPGWASEQEFKSKGFVGKRSAEWNELFNLHVPCDPEDARLIIALYDRIGTYGREALVGYTIVPLSYIMSNGLASAAGEPAAHAADPNALGGARRPVFAFELHKTTDYRGRSAALNFLRSGESKGNSQPPTLQLSLALHTSKKPARPLRRRVKVASPISHVHVTPTASVGAAGSRCSSL